MDETMYYSYPLLFFALYFMNCLFLGIFFHVTLREKLPKQKIVIFSFITALVLLSFRFFVPVSFIMFPSLLFIIFACKIVFNFGTIKSIVAVLLSQIAALIGEVIVMLVDQQLEIPKFESLTNIRYVIFDNVLSSFIFLSIIIIIYYFNIRINLVEDIIKKKYIGVVINAIITITLITPNLMFFGTSQYHIPKIIILFNIMSYIILFSLCIYNTYKNNELERKKSDLEYQKLYNKTLSDFADGLKLFKHDLANILNSINGYISLDDMQGLKKYFTEFLDDYTSIITLNSVNESIIKNPSIYGLLSSKLYLAESKGIKMQIEITTDLNNSDVKIYDLCKILGILIDNAIEASNESESKFLKMSMKNNSIDNTYVITIENSFPGKINIHEIYNKGISSKGSSRGLGLWEVKAITGKYRTVDLRTSINENIFKQELTIQTMSFENAV